LGQRAAACIYLAKFIGFLLQGWSPERSIRFGAAILQPIGEALPNLR